MNTLKLKRTILEFPILGPLLIFIQKIVTLFQALFNYPKSTSISTSIFTMNKIYKKYLHLIFGIGKKEVVTKSEYLSVYINLNKLD